MHVFRVRPGLAPAAGFVLFSLSLAAGASLGACDGENATSRKRVSLATSIVADDAVEAPITNAFGWTIRLDHAALSIGPLYYFSGSPVIAGLAPPRRPRDAFSRLFGIGVAHAHPGHYQPGDAMGQVLESSSVDLALGPADLPPGEGVSGVFRSGRFSFEPTPQGDAASQLAGHVVVLEGEANKDTMKRLFRFEANTSDVLDSLGESRVEGCIFEGEPDVQADGTVTIHVAPSVWLDQTEFDAVAESADGKPVLLLADSAAFRAIARGLKKAAAITFHHSTP